MLPNDCRNFETCNAAVCPLAPMEGRHLTGEKVCVYALASGKAGAAERYRDFPEFAEVCNNLPMVVARFPTIGKAVEKASKNKLKAVNADNLRRGRNALEGSLLRDAPSKRPKSRPGRVSPSPMPRTP